MIIVSRIKTWLATLRFPGLLILTLVLLGIDLVVPDVLPFVDEILLACMAALLSRWRDRDGQKKDPDRESGSDSR